MTLNNEATGDFIANTELGALRGIQEGDVIAFHGVPYAQPPVGVRRLRSPMPLQPWIGIRDATTSAPAPYQINDTNRSNIMKIAKRINLGTHGIPPRPDYADGTYSQPIVSEDCLYLEIWVPKKTWNDSKRKLPVYLYYHGGANASSSGANKNETGNNLAQEEDIIVIRPSYRGGFLGWGHFGLISDLYPEAINLGLQDQISALRWVYEHIDAFGGDQDNITVAGESAGGSAVSHLLTYPGTQPLIRRAIIQSLSSFHVFSTQEKCDAVAVAELFFQLLEIDDPAKLATLDPDCFVAAHSVLTKYFHPDRNCAWSPVGPVIDGKFAPVNPSRYLSEQRFPKDDFELVIGFAKDEWQYSRGQSDTIKHGNEDDVKAVLKQVYGKEGAELLYHSYRALYPEHEEPGHTLGDIISMEFFKFTSLAIAQNFASHGFPVWVFQFSFDLPGYGGWLRAVHTADCPIIFRNLDERTLSHFPGYDGVNRGLLRKMATEFGSMYAGYIRNGDPGSKWKPYTTETSAILWLSQRCTSKPHLLDEEIKAFQQVGIVDFETLRYKLVTNTRRALNTRRRAFAANNDVWTDD